MYPEHKKRSTKWNCHYYYQKLAQSSVSDVGKPDGPWNLVRGVCTGALMREHSYFTTTTERKTLGSPSRGLTSILALQWLLGWHWSSQTSLWVAVKLGLVSFQLGTLRTQWGHITDTVGKVGLAPSRCVAAMTTALKGREDGCFLLLPKLSENRVTARDGWPTITYYRATKGNADLTRFYPHSSF